MTVASLAAVDRGIPRKFTARRGDKHFDQRVLSYLSDKGVDVFVDGKLLDQVASWDVEAGFVTRHRRDRDGSLVIEDGVPTFETLKGAIEVRWASGSAA